MTRETVRRYAELSGDWNPLHVDEEYGATSEFGHGVPHGSLCFQPCFESLAAGLGVQALPAGTQVRMRFLRQVLLDDTVEFRVTRVAEADGWLLVEGECCARDETVAAIVARMPLLAPRPMRVSA
ncbi:MAG: 3-hydroxybutyryl-CoA dehydratase [Thermoleophilaceae bacterium]|jgi:3-hydroxybutyryl-CoA dehydratase|nr:3-hydroxybutyryl-CoA dehydratase [Thermoleophilaceae bacterium]